MALDVTTWTCGPPPRSGQNQRYPDRFWPNVDKHYPGLVGRPGVLHMFSGSMDWGDTTDLRPETGCTFPAPYDAIPRPDGSYDAVFADPPYNKGFSSEWTTHARHLPRPKRILKEAARLTKEGGLVFILHVIVIPAYAGFGVRRIALHPVLAGPNNAIRVLNVFRRVAA